MEYRELGRTGLRVSEIGLGCEGFVGKTEEETQALMTQAVEAGVNCMDLYTPDPDLRSRVGRALPGQAGTVRAAGASVYRLAERPVQSHAGHRRGTGFL